MGKVEDTTPRKCGTCKLCEQMGEHEIDRTLQHGEVTIPRDPDHPYQDVAGLRENGGCLWLRGIWGDDMATRPDNTGVVPWVVTEDSGYKAGTIRLFVRPNRPMAWNKNATRNLIRGAWMQGRQVFVIDGSGKDLAVTDLP